VDVHIRLVRYVPDGKEKEYWKQPEVWKDLKASFDKFFENCPDANGTRQRYVLYSYRCEQWEELSRQLGLLKSVDYDYFDGKPRFEEIQRLAREHSFKWQEFDGLRAASNLPLSLSTLDIVVRFPPTGYRCNLLVSPTYHFNNSSKLSQSGQRSMIWKRN